MTGAELYAYVLEAFKRTDKETEAYEAMTDCVMEIKRRHHAEDFKSVSTALQIVALGDYYIALPTDFGHLIGEVRMNSLTDGKVLKKISKAEYDRLLPFPNYASVTKAEPTAFCIYANRIYLYGVPDKITHSYYLNYTTEAATAMIAGTTVVPFSVNFREMLKFGILWRLFADVKNEEQAMKYRALFEDAFNVFHLTELRNSNAPMCTEYRDV